MTLVDGYVLFPGDANWKESLRGSRDWETGIETALAGNEERWALIANTKKSLSFLVTLANVQQLAILTDRIQAAQKSAKACCPHYGRGLKIAGNVSGDEVEFDNPGTLAVGDFVFFQRMDMMGEGSYDVREILSEAAGVFTLDSAVSQTYLAGTYAWPVFFGCLKVETLTAQRGTTGQLRLTFGPPVETNAQLDDECSSGGTIFPVLAYATQDACNTLRLQWYRSINASSYKVLAGDAPGGPYVEVDTTTDLYLEIEAPLFLPEYYVVVAVRDDLESDESNEVKIEAITLERVMRVIQERRRQSFAWSSSAASGAGDWILWANYANLYFGVDPGKYPVDGFYDAQVFSAPGVVDSAQVYVMLQDISDAFHDDNWLNNFGVDGDWEAAPLIQVHGAFAGTVGKKESMGDWSAQVYTEENYEEKMRELVSRICDLEWLCLQADTQNHENRYVNSNGLKYWQFSFGGLQEVFCFAPSFGDLTDNHSRGWANLENNSLWDKAFNFHYNNGDEASPVSYSPSEAYGDTYYDLGPINAFIGQWSAVGTYASREGEHGNHWAWTVNSYCVRGEVFLDLTGVTLGSDAKVFLWVKQFADGANAVSGQATPISSALIAHWGYWASGTPSLGTDWAQTITESEAQPNLPAGAGATTPVEFLNEGTAFEGYQDAILNTHSSNWQLEDQVVQVYRSPKIQDGHWIHYAML